jgi:CRP/FNR family transcriptional regulator
MAAAPMTAADTALQRALAAMPALAALPPALREDVGASLNVVHLPAGSVVFRANEGCQGFPIVLQGRVEVARHLDSGREFALYEVGAGESCVMSTGCLLGNSHYNAQGRCLTDVELAIIPRPMFERLVAEHKPFREEVFGLFVERMQRLMELVEEVGFQRLDQRLAAALLGKGQRVEMSHEQLAHALGVSRESVSRQLKQFEEHGWVKLGRGAVDVLDPRALRERAAHGSAALVAAGREADAAPR